MATTRDAYGAAGPRTMAETNAGSSLNTHQHANPAARGSVAARGNFPRSGGLASAAISASPSAQYDRRYYLAHRAELLPKARATSAARRAKLAAQQESLELAALRQREDQLNAAIATARREMNAAINRLAQLTLDRSLVMKAIGTLALRPLNLSGGPETPAAPKHNVTGLPAIAKSRT